MRMALIDATTAGSVIAYATSTHPDFIGFWRTRACR